MVKSCYNCGKYVFDAENFSIKRMSVIEYIDGVIRRNIRTNKPTNELATELGLEVNWLVNQAPCELCGAPHAVFSHPDHNDVVHVSFFFSGRPESSERDRRFVADFRENLV